MELFRVQIFICFFFTNNNKFSVYAISCLSYSKILNLNQIENYDSCLGIRGCTTE